MVYLIVLLAVLARFIPHIPNFSPVYGALLFGGARLRKRDSIWFPLVLLGASDVVLTNVIYRMSIGWAELIQIVAFAAIAMIGWLLRPRVTLLRFSFACAAGPTAFYLISDFGVWLGWQMSADLGGISSMLYRRNSVLRVFPGQHLPICRSFVRSLRILPSAACAQRAGSNQLARSRCCLALMFCA